MPSVQDRVVLLLAGTLLLGGCDRIGELMLSRMEQNVVLSAQPIQLQPEPLTLKPDPALEVRGETSDLCFALADGVSLDDDGDKLDAREKSLLHGSTIHALLHDDQGKTYPWTCGGWQLTPASMESKTGRLYSCARRQCNDAKPPKGATITSVDVSATPKLRVLEITWSSTDSFDHSEQH